MHQRLLGALKQDLSRGSYIMHAGQGFCQVNIRTVLHVHVRQAKAQVKNTVKVVIFFVCTCKDGCNHNNIYAVKLRSLASHLPQVLQNGFRVFIWIKELSRCSSFANFLCSLFKSLMFGQKQKHLFNRQTFGINSTKYYYVQTREWAFLVMDLNKM